MINTHSHNPHLNGDSEDVFAHQSHIISPDLTTGQQQPVPLEKLVIGPTRGVARSAESDRLQHTTGSQLLHCSLGIQSTVGTQLFHKNCKQLL